MAQTIHQKKTGFKNIDKFLSSVYFFPKNNKTYPPLKKDDVDDVLLLGLFATADTILYIPAIKVIKKNFPNARITMACAKAVQGILKEQNLVDEFFVVKRPWGAKKSNLLTSISNSFSGIKTVNYKTYDLAIDFTGDWRALLYMNFIKAGRKVSYRTEAGGYMLTDPVIPNAEIDHLTDEAFYLLKKIGCEFNHTEKAPVLTLTEENHDVINEFKLANKLEDKFIVGVYPGATADSEKWGEEKYSELIIRLSINYSNCIFIIFGDIVDKTIVAKIGKALKANNIFDYLVVSKPLPDLTLLGSLCHLVICNDSSAAQIAAAYNLPALVIFGKAAAETDEPDEQAAVKKFVAHSLEGKKHTVGTDGISVEQVYNPAIEMVNSLKKLTGI
jgi:ADP-heptose:LPS heptosyltransferase